MTRIAALTGLSEDYVDRVDLRPEHIRFLTELLRDQRRTVGRIDGRFAGWDADYGRETVDDRSVDRRDHRPVRGGAEPLRQGRARLRQRPAVRGADRPRASVVLQGVRGRSTCSCWTSWPRRCGSTRICGVHVACGYYDAATPVLRGRDTTSLTWPSRPSWRANIEFAYYEAGHMMYMHEPSRLDQSARLAAFVHGQLPGSLAQPGRRRPGCGRSRPRPRSRRTAAAARRTRRSRCCPRRPRSRPRSAPGSACRCRRSRRRPPGRAARRVSKLSLRPQATTRPSAVRAALWLTPAAIAITPSRPAGTVVSPKSGSPQARPARRWSAPGCARLPPRRRRPRAARAARRPGRIRCRPRRRPGRPATARLCSAPAETDVTPPRPAGTGPGRSRCCPRRRPSRQWSAPGCGSRPAAIAVTPRQAAGTSVMPSALLPQAMTWPADVTARL